MPKRDIIVVGASAGGVRTLQQLAGLLPANLPASVFVVQHLSAESPGYLADMVTRAGPLPASFPEDGTRIARGQIYIAPPDRHMLIQDGTMRVVRGPKENLHRPAIDPLFRSAAWSYGPRVTGVILTGTRDDGASGLWAVKSSGGLTVVQNPEEALHPEMPRNAMALLDVDYCLTLEEIGALLPRLAEQVIEQPAATQPDNIGLETEFAMGERDFPDMKKLGVPSGYSCPTCGGSLWEIKDGEFVRFRCHVGHAFQAPALITEKSCAIEESLEAAMQALQEKAALASRMATRSAEFPFKHQTERYAERARAAQGAADDIRNLLVSLRD